MFQPDLEVSAHGGSDAAAAVRVASQTLCQRDLIVFESPMTPYPSHMESPEFRYPSPCQWYILYTGHFNIYMTVYIAMMIKLQYHNMPGIWHK